MATVLLPARRTRQQAWSRSAPRPCGRGCRSLLLHSPPLAFACGGSHSSEHHPGIVGTVIPGIPLVCPHPTSPGFPPPALPGTFGATHLAATRPDPACLLRDSGCARARHRQGFPCCSCLLLRTCPRQYPGGTERRWRWSPPGRWQPSPYCWRVAGMDSPPMGISDFPGSTATVTLAIL